MPKPNKGYEMKRKFLDVIDSLVCCYLGLKKLELTPHIVEKKDDQLIMVNTESFKRYAYKVPVNKVNVSIMNRESKEKVGIAIGKTIATNLVISFEEIIIKRKEHAR